MRKEVNKAACSQCGFVLPIAAKDLCRTCYQRERRTGSAVPKPKVQRLCGVPDCGRPHVVHGLCEIHRDRMRRHGHIEQTRPNDWGRRSNHPLYKLWKHVRRTWRVDARWEEFWAFVEDVGARPGERASVVPLDEKQHLGPENFQWRQPLVSGKYGAEYARAHRKANPRYWRDRELRRSFGVGLEEYEAMERAQGGKCAICRQPETTMDFRHNKVRALAVDHCHATGKVRALLCLRCNQGLGNFADSPTRLKQAIDYLASHGVT